MKTYRGVEVLLYHSCPQRYMEFEWLVSCPCCFNPGTNWLVGPQNLDDVEKRKNLALIGTRTPAPHSSSPKPVAIPTALSCRLLTKKDPQIVKCNSDTLSRQRERCASVGTRTCCVFCGRKVHSHHTVAEEKQLKQSRSIYLLQRCDSFWNKFFVLKYGLDLE
jgi:hypothetical protein